MKVQLFEQFSLSNHKVDIITNISDTDLDNAVELAFNQFSQYHDEGTHGMIKQALYGMTDKDISTVIYIDGELAGCLLLKDMNVNATPYLDIQTDELDDLNGVFGNAFVIAEKFRNTRIVALLVKELRSHGFDYVWFGQYDDYTGFIRYGNKAKHICDSNFGYGTIHFYYSLI
jgi:hypothetical protein